MVLLQFRLGNHINIFRLPTANSSNDYKNHGVGVVCWCFLWRLQVIKHQKRSKSETLYSGQLQKWRLDDFHSVIETSESEYKEPPVFCEEGHLGSA